jgi:hypothetical protein
MKWGEMDQYPGEGKTDFQALDTQERIPSKIDIPKGLRFERINEVTWKLTNGEMTNVPALSRAMGRLPHHQGSGLGDWRRTRMDRSPQRQTTNPMSLAKAKAAALAMARNKCSH